MVDYFLMGHLRLTTSCLMVNRTLIDAEGPAFPYVRRLRLMGSMEAREVELGQSLLALFPSQVYYCTVALAIVFQPQDRHL